MRRGNGSCDLPLARRSGPDAEKSLDMLAVSSCLSKASRMAGEPAEDTGLPAAQVSNEIAPALEELLDSGRDLRPNHSLVVGHNVGIDLDRTLPLDGGAERSRLSTRSPAFENEERTISACLAAPPPCTG